MLGGYYLGQLYLGISGLPSAGVLSLVPASHQLTSDNIALTQKHTIVVSDALHGHTAGNITLTQKHLLAVENAIHTLMTENVAITSEQVLGIDSAFHGLTSTTLGLTQKHTIVVNNTSHSLVSANVDLTEHKTLVVANTLHNHTSDNLPIVVHFYLVVQNAQHGHTSQSLALTQKQLLAVANTLHGLTSTNLAGLLSIDPFGFGGGFGAVDGFGYSGFGTINTELVQNYYIRGLDSYHSLPTQSVALSQKHTLVTQDGYILVTSPQVNITQVIWFDGGVYIKDFADDGAVGGEYTPDAGTSPVNNGSFGQITPVSDDNQGFLILKMGQYGSYTPDSINSGIIITDNSSNGSLSPEVIDTGNYTKSNNNNGEYEVI